nr:hypothetical protein [Tanacetum cinerariifolium]
MPNVDIPHGIDTGGRLRRQETMGGTSTQTRSERVLEQPNEPPFTEGHTSGSGEDKLEENVKLTDIVPTPHDLPLIGGYTPGSDEGRITLAELMEICTTLSNRVTQLETKLSTAKAVYNEAFITLTNRLSLDEELEPKLYDEELAKEEARQEQKRYNLEKALELQRQLDERKENVPKGDQAKEIDWNDPQVLRYHTLQNRPFSKAKVRKIMIVYLNNQGGCKRVNFIHQQEDVQIFKSDKMHST